MDCPHCHSSSTREREGRTAQGFRRYGCRDCGRRYNERTGTALNRVTTEAPSDENIAESEIREQLGKIVSNCQFEGGQEQGLSQLRGQ
jgi:transcriptional regulator NrdR family protein